MYRSCIFCSADLKANEALERFPVGRSIAFDGEKGRLWAVCPRCARWNLAPIEERWEALEDAERLFRDTRTRVQRENIGLAKLRDGTRLIRVGAALSGELAVWRYGESLVRRRRRHLVLSAIGTAVFGGLITASVMGASVTMGGTHLLWYGSQYVRDRLRARRPVARLTAEQTGNGQPAVIGQEAVRGARLSEASDGTLCLRFPDAQEVLHPIGRGIYNVVQRDLVLRGDLARRVLPRAMVVANAKGASRALVEQAVGVLGREQSPADYVRRTAAEGFYLSSGMHTPAQRLAVEMALHEETERRALDGELSALEEMWRQAEQIAAIADRLPGVLDPAEPPRVTNAG
ncbi:MAG TPA: hypothetical protein VK358_10625 [Longimicrobium sp.]|nr:hypothetical protein [Longimicrobium sp.]